MNRSFASLLIPFLFFAILPPPELAHADGLIIKAKTTTMFVTWQQTPTLTTSTNLTVRPQDAAWSSSNPAVATVDALGRIRAVAAGTTSVTATHGGAEAQLVLEVKAPQKQPEILGPEDLHPVLTTSAAGSVYQVPVVILRYLPTADRVNLDVSFDPDYYALGPISLEQPTGNIDLYDKRVKFMLGEGTRLRGSGNPTAAPSIDYRVVAYITVYEPTPPGEASFDPQFPDLPMYYPDFHQILARFGGERYVNELGVKGFWLRYLEEDAG